MSIFIIALCFLMAGFLTLLEAAFIHLSAEDLAETRKAAQAAVLQKLIPVQDRVITALRTGYLFFVILLIVLATQLLAPLSVVGIVMAVLVIMTGLLVFTDYLPRSHAMKQEPEALLELMLFVRGAYYCFLAPAYVISGLGAQWTHLFKNHFLVRENLFNAAEYRALLQRADDGEAKQQKNRQQALEKISALTVQDLMMPAEALEMIDGDLPMEEWIEQLLAGHDQRVIVTQDGPENIVGVLHMPLMMKAIALAEGDKNAVDISSAISEPVYASPYTTVIDQINAFQQGGQHFALVRDRQGQVLGAIALETLVENLAASLRN